MEDSLEEFLFGDEIPEEVVADIFHEPSNNDNEDLGLVVEEDETPVSPRVLPARPMHFTPFDPVADLQQYVSTLPPLGEEWTAERMYTQLEVDDMLRDTVPTRKYLDELARYRARWKYEHRKVVALEKQLKECRTKVERLENLLRD